jgi:hypothetical protein
MSRRVSVPARMLSLVGVLATAALLLLIFVFPAYTTAGAELSSQTGAVIQSTGSATIFASNPHAFTAVMGITGLAVVTLGLTLVTAWSNWSPARWALLALIIPLTGLAVLALFSIGVFMAPLVTIAWVVFALRGQRDRQGSSQNSARS